MICETCGKKAEPSIGEDSKKILFAGRLSDESGILELTKAFAYTLKKKSELKERIQLWIIGHGRLVKSVLEIAKNSNIEENVVFLHYLSDDEYRKIIGKADVCVIAPVEVSISVFWFAQDFVASGKPIIATKKSALEDILRPLGCTLFVDPRDVHVYSQTLLTALSMGVEQKREFESCYETIFSNLTERSNSLLQSGYSEQAEAILNYLAWFTESRQHFRDAEKIHFELFEVKRRGITTPLSAGNLKQVFDRLKEIFFHLGMILLFRASQAKSIEEYAQLLKQGTKYLWFCKYVPFSYDSFAEFYHLYYQGLYHLLIGIRQDRLDSFLKALKCFKQAKNLRYAYFSLLRGRYQSWPGLLELLDSATLSAYYAFRSLNTLTYKTEIRHAKEILHEAYAKYNIPTKHQLHGQLAMTTVDILSETISSVETIAPYVVFQRMSNVPSRLEVFLSVTGIIIILLGLIYYSSRSTFEEPLQYFAALFQIAGFLFQIPLIMKGLRMILPK